MPSQKKVEIVGKIEEILKAAKALILTQYQGLSTPQLETLKKEIEKANGRFLVVKNTLLKVALKKSAVNFPDDVFKGPTAAVIASDDGLNALKALSNFAKATDGRPVVKVSFVENRIFDATQSLMLSSLPGREVLLGKLINLLNSPFQRLVSVLKADQKKLVFVLKEVARLRQV